MQKVYRYEVILDDADRLGIKRSHLAEALHISTKTLYRKMAGTSPFLAGEMRIVGELLGWSLAKMSEVFFEELPVSI